jgi:hypothetical protein
MFWEVAAVERGTIPAPLTISPSSSLMENEGKPSVAIDR